MSSGRAHLGLSLSLSLLLAPAACSSEDSTRPGADDGGGGATTTTSSTGGAGGGATGGGGGGGASPAPACEPGTKPGDPAGAEGLQTGLGVTFNVRVPAGYDPTAASPLIVVYAPAGANEQQTETFTKLTPDAHARGYVIAYVDHVTPNTAAKIADVAGVATQIGQSWCIDPARVYLTGHSDGGSVATLIALQADIALAAIAPSAAGADGAYLAQQPCPPPLAVMVLHSKNDSLFPGFGAEAADYWAGCEQCQPTPGAPDADGCIAYPGCAMGVEVRYCEGSGSHGTWPNKNAAMLDFFGLFTHPAQ